MAESRKDPVDRREFLKGAAAGAAGAAAFMPGVAGAQQPAAQDHDHDHQVVPSDVALRVKALESLLVEKGMVDPAAIDATVDLYENKVGPRNGARVVARAWVDPAYKKRLLDEATGTAAIAELGYSGAQGEYMIVLENTPKCTTSSCARCARATRGRRSACRPRGTSPPRTAHAP